MRTAKVTALAAVIALAGGFLALQLYWRRTQARQRAEERAERGRVMREAARHVPAWRLERLDPQPGGR